MGIGAVLQRYPDSAGDHKCMLTGLQPLQLCHFWQVFAVVLELSHLTWVCQVCIVQECPYAPSVSHLSEHAVKSVCSHLAILHAYLLAYNLSCCAALRCVS